MTCDAAETVSVCVVVVLTANPAPAARSSASRRGDLLAGLHEYCMAVTLRVASSAAAHLPISSVESNSTW